jgi:hypothetical protein
LAEFFDTEVRPRLTAEIVFTHRSHDFKADGHKLRGGCPWHRSKSGSSFYIDARTLCWRCPACQIGGGPLQYVHRLNGGTGVSPRGADFVALVRRCCELVGVPFPARELSDEERELARRKESRRAVLATVISICQERVRSPEGEAARAYLRERGFDDLAVEEFSVGLYPDDLAELRQKLRAAGHQESDITEAVVVSSKMRGYISFPWNDAHGDPLTLYGTWPGLSPPAGKPKKMTLPNPRSGREDWEQTKRSPLYFDRAREAGHRDLVAVEGVTDAAYLQSLGDTRVIAYVGAEFSHAQIETLRRYAIKSVIIVPDPDAAGNGGARSCTRQLRDAGIAAYVAPRLPDGLDPDEFVLREGLDAWKAHVHKAIHGYRYMARSILAQEGEREPGDDSWSDGVVDRALVFARSLPTDRDEEMARHFWPEIAQAIGGDSTLLRQRVRTTEQPCGADSHRTDGGSDAVDGLATTRLSSLKPRPVTFAVPEYIPLGKLVMVAGDGGHGKTFLTIGLTADVTQGQCAFGLEYPDPLQGDVLLISCEDDYEDTVLPRLLAAGADVSRVHRVDGVRGNDGKLLPFSMAHYERMEQHLAANPDIRLVIIDPAGAYIGRTGIDDHRDSELRALLGPMAEVAGRRAVTILLVKHINRNTGAAAVHRVTGSSGYVNTVRAAFLVAPDPDEPERKFLLPIKFNLGRKPPGLAYRVVGLADGERGPILAPFTDLAEDDRQRLGEQLCRLDWEGTVDADPNEVLSRPGGSPRGPSKVEQAVEWLREFLKEFAYPSDEVFAAGASAGFTEKNLYAAKKQLVITASLMGFQQKWWWGLGAKQDWKQRPQTSPRGGAAVMSGNTADSADTANSGN